MVVAALLPISREASAAGRSGRRGEADGERVVEAEVQAVLVDV
jgi:hypothetical protein